MQCNAILIIALITLLFTIITGEQVCLPDKNTKTLRQGFYIKYPLGPSTTGAQ